MKKKKLYGLGEDFSPEHAYYVGYRKGVEDAAKIAASNECSIAGFTEVCNCDIEIAAKIRALMGGG